MPSSVVSQKVVVTPQASVIVVVLTVDEDGDAAARDFLADFAGLVQAVAFRLPEDRLSAVLGIGATWWDRAFADLPRPACLHPFVALDGDVHRAPSTPGDLVLHLRADRFDLCFELATRLRARFEGFARVVDEVHGFRYFDQRDLMGFVDGTESPVGEEAAETAYVGDEDPRFAGGSYLIVQKYLHDMDAWNRLTVEQQERVIGRTKADDIEFPDDQKAPDAHIVLNQVTDEEGNERPIVRENMPFGSVGSGEFGTYFIGYAADPGVTEEMLRNMFLGKPAGTYDRILDFSTAVTGSLFFVPSADFLEDQTIADPAPAAPAPAPTTDGSLGIGGLRRTTPSGGIA